MVIALGVTLTGRKISFAEPYEIVAGPQLQGNIYTVKSLPCEMLFQNSTGRAKPECPPARLIKSFGQAYSQKNAFGRYFFTGKFFDICGLSEGLLWRNFKLKQAFFVYCQTLIIVPAHPSICVFSSFPNLFPRAGLLWPLLLSPRGTVRFLPHASEIVPIEF